MENKRICTFLHRLLHYSTLQTQFPTRNFHSVYIIRYQYGQNNTQGRARWRTSGYSEREKARVALSFSLLRALRLYCLLLNMGTANPWQEKVYITLCFAQLGVSLANEWSFRVLALLTSTHCHSRIIRARLPIEYRSPGGASHRGTRAAPLYLPIFLLYCALPSVTLSLHCSGWTAAKPGTLLLNLLTSNVRITSFIGCNAISSNLFSSWSYLPLLSNLTTYRAGGEAIVYVTFSCHIVTPPGSIGAQLTILQVV
jgi:hypothetical protein